MPGMDTMAGLMPMVMDTGLMAMDTTTERGLPMLSPLLRLMLPLRLMLMPGTDTMAMASTDLMATDTTDTGLMAMDTITERGLLMLSPLLLLLPMLLLPLMLMPGTDTMAGLMPTVMDTGLMAMDTTMERGLLMLSPLLRLLLPLR